MNALATISTLPSNKEELTKFARMLKDEILDSTKDPLPILVQLKVIEKVVADVLKDEEIKYHFLKEFLLYEKEKSMKVQGATLEQREIGVKWDYNASGDIKWMDLDKQIKEFIDARKEREKLLQNLPPEGLVDPDTGNYITRPPKSSETMVIVKL